MMIREREPERDWRAYFQQHLKGRTTLAYMFEHWAYNAPAFHRTLRHVPPRARILDVGCGVGATLIYLAALGYDVWGIDKEPEVVELAREHLDMFGSPARAMLGDAWNLSALGTFDLAFSIGVLEHFDPDDFVLLLREQAKVARYVFTVVPTSYTRPIIDERIYSGRQLRAFFRRAGLQVLESFGYGDLFTFGRLHKWAYYLLPNGLYRILQDHVGYAMGRACFAVRHDGYGSRTLEDN